LYWTKAVVQKYPHYHHGSPILKNNTGRVKHEPISAPSNSLLLNLGSQGQSDPSGVLKIFFRICGCPVLHVYLRFRTSVSLKRTVIQLHVSEITFTSRLENIS
jgi:hypothetical protein